MSTTDRDTNPRVPPVACPNGHGLADVTTSFFSGGDVLDTLTCGCRITVPFDTWGKGTQP
jgi:hypothetical protein